MILENIFTTRLINKQNKKWLPVPWNCAPKCDGILSCCEKTIVLLLSADDKVDEQKHTEAEDAQVDHVA